MSDGAERGTSSSTGRERQASAASGEFRESLPEHLRNSASACALEVESERLVGLGARRAERHDATPMSGGHIVMRDPEDNEFCLDWHAFTEDRQAELPEP